MAIKGNKKHLLPVVREQLRGEKPLYTLSEFVCSRGCFDEFWACNFSAQGNIPIFFPFLKLAFFQFWQQTFLSRICRVARVRERGWVSFLNPSRVGSLRKWRCLGWKIFALDPFLKIWVFLFLLSPYFR